MSTLLKWYETDRYGGRKAWHLGAVYVIHSRRDEWVAEVRVDDGLFEPIALSGSETDAKQACEAHAARRGTEATTRGTAGKDGTP